MKQNLTIKIKLVNPDDDTFSALTTKFMQTCNYVSNWIFNHDFLLSPIKIQDNIYYELRSKFKMPSQLTISAIRCTAGEYITVKKQLKQKPFKYYDRATKKTSYVSRDLTWLQHPLHFKKSQADLQRGRDWRFTKDNELSIATLGNRAKVKYIGNIFKQYKDWHLGLGKLVKRKNNWYLYISISKNIPECENDTIKHIVGIDRGLRFLATCYDENGKTRFYSGKQIAHINKRYHDTREQLRAKGTKSAKRRLKKIGHRENRWRSDVNHCLSKALVNQYGPHTLFVLEDLTGIKADITKIHKGSSYYKYNAWAFYQLEQDLIYKANLNQSKVIKVPPEYTSQRCVKCGQIDKNNRNHNLHLYTCNKCGYTSNDDRIAAMNIQFLGKEYLIDNKKHRFNVN